MDATGNDLHHGGNLAAAEERFGRPRQGWLDLSTGINPAAYPLPALPPEAWARLPDGAQIAALLAAAQDHYGVPDRGCIVAAPGSQALIQWLPRLMHSPATDTTVAVLTPTYGEHARSWAGAGFAVDPVADFSAVTDRHTIVVLANPNNPDGRQIAPDRLLALAGRLAARGGLLVVDEAFADLTPRLSLASAAGRPGLVILRSFGKFFGLGGLRLGFALGPAALIDRLADALGPWPVSGPATRIGAAALTDSAWIAMTRQALANATQRLDALLTGAGLSLVGGTDLFRLVEHPAAPTLFERLGRAGILVRDFPERPRWLRFGIPTESGFDRLSESLNGWTSHKDRNASDVRA
ncbi:threonine-phosphate decarboxylase CobD [Rhodospirillaceae bacterium SYSU D60014]|uniref:threonine-phosphate decarboxylase CobD n=1 Tax=Virgifigura deserti TaxID=2268457 RepID=UPI000E663BF2